MERLNDRETAKQLEAAKKTYTHLTENPVVVGVVAGGVTLLVLYLMRYFFDAATGTIVSYKKFIRACKV